MIAIIYGRSITWGFVIDDHRLLAHCREYAAGQRTSLNLYRFLLSSEQVRRLRADGYYPWWLADDVRYKHFRPLAESVLYGEYRLFGEWGGGYRIVSFTLYALSALLVLRILREVGGDERVARWGALAYVVTTGHAVPVLFVAQQCDLIGLVPSLAGILAGARYVRAGGGVCFVLAAALFGLSLGAKESSLGACLLPLALAWKDQRGIRTRAIVLSSVLTCLGLAWLAMYVKGGNGANTAMMLDPIHAPADYFAALPGRVIAMLTSWIIPTNPFVFCMHSTFRPILIGYIAVGAVVLTAVGRMLWKWRTERRGVISMALWPVPFLPLLACTPPDDRNMLLPGIGLAFLAAVWMTAPRRGGAVGLRRFPFALFIIINAVSAIGVSFVLQFLEVGGERTLASAVAGFGRPVKAGDTIFVVNSAEDTRILFSQYAIERMTGSRDLRVAHLCDIDRPTVTRTGVSTIRIEGREEALLDGFFGRMGRTRDRPRQVGDEFDAGEYFVRITKVEGDHVREIEAQFRRPLDDDGYRFYWSDLAGVEAISIQPAPSALGG